MDREKKLEIANLIRKGASYPDTVEDKGMYIGKRWRNDEPEYNACAWGLAYIGTFNTAKEAWEHYVYSSDAIWTLLKTRLGVTHDSSFFETVEHLHHDKDIPAEHIADMIERGVI